MKSQRWLRIIPVALIMYTISYVDRTNVALALDPKISSMMRDLLMDDRMKGHAAGIFFFGYVLLQIPGGYFASRWSPKAPLSHAQRCGMRHSDFFTPALPPVGGRGRQTWPCLKGHVLIHSLMQREAEQHRKCDWHFVCALICRGRRLSARNSGSASPVEACHPRAYQLYQRILQIVLYSPVIGEVQSNSTDLY